MKRVGVFLMLCLTLILSSCSAGTKESKALGVFTSKIEDAKSYELKAKLEVVKLESTVSFNMEVIYEAPSNFKVTYVNEANNSRQVLLKNSDGVFVLSPELNKEFKFESTWPLNSSHIYILNKIVSDLKEAEDVTTKTENDFYIIKSSIKHKIRKDLVSQSIYLNTKDYSLDKITFDGADKALMTLVVNELNFDLSLKSDTFNVDAIMDSETSLIGEGSLDVITEVSFAPIFEGVSLKASSVMDEYTILSYDGTKKYSIIYQDVHVGSVSAITRIYDDFIMLDSGLGFVASNSLTFYFGDKEFRIISDNLTLEEMVSLANSLEAS